MAGAVHTAQTLIINSRSNRLEPCQISISRFKEGEGGGDKRREYFGGRVISGGETFLEDRSIPEGCKGFLTPPR